MTRKLTLMMTLASLMVCRLLAFNNPEVRELDIDVDSDYDCAITDADDSIETNKGGIVFVGGWTNITIRQAVETSQPGDSNTVRLSWITNHIELADTRGGSPITIEGYMDTAQTTAYKDYPGLNSNRTLWVHGISTSHTARAEAIRLELQHYDEAYDPNSHDEIAITVVDVDLDIDSDHTSDYGAPQRDDNEDDIEDEGDDPHQALKYVVANNYYRKSTNGMPGFADFDMSDPDGPATSSIIMPIKLEISAILDVDPSTAKITFDYDASSPSSVTSNQLQNGDWQWPVPTDGRLRLWTVRGPRNKKSVLETDGNYVPANEKIPFDKLGLPGEITLYLEGISPSTELGGDSIKVSVDLTDSVQKCAEDTIKCTVVRVNADVDNYNDSEFSASVHEADYLAEDHHEDRVDSNHVGRLIIVDDDDRDMDGIPDFADGYNLFTSVSASSQTTNAQFVPIVFEIPEPIDLTRCSIKLTYDDSNPMDVTTNADGSYNLPNQKALRIWTKDGNVARNGKSVLDGGDFLAATEYSAEDFGFTNNVRKVVYYMEAVYAEKDNKTPGKTRILFQVKPDERTGFMAADAVLVTAVPMFMTPDFNRDGVIDDGDKKRMAKRGLFRFWINDDRDAGFWATHPMEDSPKNSYQNISSWLTWLPFMGSSVDDREDNCNDDVVNGVRDMVDFFPVRLGLPRKLLGTNFCSYALVQTGEAINMAYTPLEVSAVSKFYQSTNDFSFYGKGRDEQATNAIVYKVTGNDFTLDELWIQHDYQIGKDSVIVMEGRTEAQGPLQLKLKYKDKAIGSWYMGLSVSPVKKMLRHLNIRTIDSYNSQHTKPNLICDPFGWLTRASKVGSWATDTNDPPNNPDGFYGENGQVQKTIVWVHGLDWDHEETPAGHAEQFKRLFQSGCNARYLGVSWASDMSRRIGQPLAYGSDVIGAFVAAPYLKTNLTQGGFAGDNTTVIAHSLGNMLVSSAIVDHNLQVKNYALLNPAVAIEAYEGRKTNSAYYGMIFPDWTNQSNNVYSERVMCAAWADLFSSSDPRSAIRWHNRFSGITNNVTAHQFYSEGEEILRQPNGTIPELALLKNLLSTAYNWIPWVQDSDVNETLVQGEFVWVYNEITKGEPGLFDQLLVDNHNHAGWKFRQDLVVDADGNESYVKVPAAVANALPTADLIASPIFDCFEKNSDADIPNWPNAANTLSASDGSNSAFPVLPLANGSMDQIKWHAKLLAEEVPPLSGPAGSIACEKMNTKYNLMDYRDLELWRKDRSGKCSNQRDGQRWLHGDYKDAPYLLTHKLYQEFVTISEQ